jgi:hypothetical protein
VAPSKAKGSSADSHSAVAQWATEHPTGRNEEDRKVRLTSHSVIITKLICHLCRRRPRERAANVTRTRTAWVSGARCARRVCAG